MSVVTLMVSCSSSGVRAERRFDKGSTISTVKGKLELVVGVPAGSMKLQLRDDQNSVICTLEGEDTMLGAFPVADFLNLHVVNTDNAAVVGEFEDVSKVEKYEMSDDAYAQRAGTVQDFKRKLKLGRFNPEAQKEAEEKQQEELAKAATIKRGDRCEAQLKVGGKHRGTVRYVGETEFSSGIWVGVEFDEPYGKHDGEVKGKRYFSCEPKYGAFVKPAAVTVGDFPPEDDLDLSDEDEM